MIGSFEVPAGWFQSVNPLFIVLLGPLFSMVWSGLARRDRNPPTPRKMALGLVLTGIGFLFMVAATFESDGAPRPACGGWCSPTFCTRPVSCASPRSGCRW